MKMFRLDFLSVFLLTLYKAGALTLLSRQNANVTAPQVCVGDEIMVTRDPAVLKSAFVGTKFSWSPAMNSILGKTLPVLRVMEQGNGIGLREAEKNSPSPIWYYPSAIISRVLKGSNSRCHGAATAGQRQLAAQGNSHGGKSCTPQCKWECGTRACDEVCKPKCKAPRCQTRCKIPSQINTNHCKLDCDKPNCAVVCPGGATCDPVTGCLHTKCQTSCSPPMCTLNCSKHPGCREVCEEPICEWECHKPSCPKPNCTMSCDMPHACGGQTYKDLPPICSDEVVVNSFGANITHAASLLSLEMAVGVSSLRGKSCTGEHVMRTVHLQRQ